MNADYLRLRRRIFQHEVIQLNEQIKKLGIMVVAFLGTALPAAFFAVLLGFGIVLKNEVPAHESLMIIWCLLLVHSMVLMLFKQAILGSSYQLYLNSIHASSLEKHFSSVVYGILCQPLLLIHLYISANISVSDWHNVPHGFLLMGLQILCGFCVMVSMRAVYWFLALSFIWLLVSVSPWLLNIALLSHLWILLGLFVFALVAAKYKLLMRTFQGFKLHAYIPLYLRVWSMHFVKQQGVIPWLVSACLLVAILCRYSALQMPHYAYGVYFIGAQIVVLIFASTQLLMNRLNKEHATFFHSHFLNASIAKLQVGVPLMCGVLGSTVFAFIQGQFYGDIVIITLFTLVLSVFTAKKFEQWFMPLAFGIALIATAVVFFVL